MLTRLSRLIRVWTELATVAGSFQQFSIYWRLNSFVQSRLTVVWTHLWPNLDPVSKCDITTGNQVACKVETASGLNKTQFTPHFETGQNCFKIFSRRQSWLVANSVHTANTDMTREDCRCRRCKLAIRVDFQALVKRLIKLAGIIMCLVAMTLVLLVQSKKYVHLNQENRSAECSIFSSTLAVPELFGVFVRNVLCRRLYYQFVVFISSPSN